MSCSCGCEGIYQNLFELLDGDCSPERAAQLRQDIEACPGCFEKLGIETEVRAIVRRTCGCEAPSSLRERITTRISITRIELQ